MAASATAVLLLRLNNLKNSARIIGNHANISFSLNCTTCLVGRKYSSGPNDPLPADENDEAPKKTLSKAMKAYLLRANEYNEFIRKETTEYKIGTRHLANMMGANPETFSQRDVDKAIQYLFPSGLFMKEARPIMKPPAKVFPPRKAAEFDESGRPFHFLFYTCNANYYQILHDTVNKINMLNEIEDSNLKSGLIAREEDKLNLVGSEWLTKDELEDLTLETISDEEFAKFIPAVQRLAEHPYASRVKDFVMKFRKLHTLQVTDMTQLQLKYTRAGRPYATTKHCTRKTARATVTVLGNGTGKITINGQDIRYFLDVQSREQDLFKQKLKYSSEFMKKVSKYCL